MLVKEVSQCVHMTLREKKQHCSNYSVNIYCMFLHAVKKLLPCYGRQELNELETWQRFHSNLKKKKEICFERLLYASENNPGSQRPFAMFIKMVQGLHPFL